MHRQLTVDLRATPCSLLLAFALAMALPGCKSAPPPPPKPELALQKLASRGYTAERHNDTTAVRETWLDGEAPLDVSLIAPTGSGRFPLVIYLPGLGESAAAGVLWRQAWAESGYAVLAIQPVVLGESVFRSQKARSGDFLGLAQEHYSIPSLKVRTQHLSYALEELKRRAGAGAGLYSKIDLRRLALAGFDLGAQSVAVLVGERIGDAGSIATHLNLRAAILLSPYVDRSASGATQRFSAITVPVLSVTGTEDADPFGLVSVPELRRRPWQDMPAGDKYLLLLAGGPHGVLAGEGFAEAGHESRADDTAKEAAARPQGAGRQRGQRGSGGSQAASQRMGAGDGGAIRGTRTFEIAHIAAVRGVTTAFLDATVKDDAGAREWLGKDAATWLGQSARLETR